SPGDSVVSVLQFQKPPWPNPSRLHATDSATAGPEIVCDVASVTGRASPAGSDIVGVAARRARGRSRPGAWVEVVGLLELKKGRRLRRPVDRDQKALSVAP